jgi:uncharacterized protein (TIGR02246 family)
MDTRAAMEAILDRAYDARRRHDAKGAAELFAQDGIFTANGLSSAKGRSEQVSTLAEVFSGFHLLDFEQHCRVIDPPYAVVHWRGTFRMKNGREGRTAVLDLIEVRDGKIASLTSFFDTAFAAALNAPA